jgi:hypothetical protein
MHRSEGCIPFPAIAFSKFETHKCLIKLDLARLIEPNARVTTVIPRQETSASSSRTPSSLMKKRYTRMLTLIIIAVALPLVSFAADELLVEIKLNDCPAPVKKTIEAEAKGSKIEKLEKSVEGDETTYWADVRRSGKLYSLGVLQDGTLTELNLRVDADEIPFAKSPSAVQVTLRKEAWDARIEFVAKDVRFGVTVYETSIEHKGKSYDIAVAEDGTLVEKMLVIHDEEVELAKCPETVRKALTELAKGGKIEEGITRSTGILHPSYEAEISLGKHRYLVEVAENGELIAQSLEANDE